FGDGQTSLDCLEFLVKLNEHAEAGGTEIVHLAEIQFNPMAASANGVIDGLADVISPVGVEPAAQFHFQDLTVLCFYDLHGSLCWFELALSRISLTGLDRGCVEDQPQHARDPLRLALRPQPRSAGAVTDQ